MRNRLFVVIGLFFLSTALHGCGRSEPDAPPAATDPESLAPGVPTEGPESLQPKSRRR